MEPQTLKKKLSTYLTEGGYLKNVPEDLLYEFLVAWQEWPGSTKEFYSSLGFTHRKMASLLGKAKKLKREGHFGNEVFKEIKNPSETDSAEISSSRNDCPSIEVRTGKGQVIRFSEVGQLMEYLDRAG